MSKEILRQISKLLSIGTRFHRLYDYEAEHISLTDSNVLRITNYASQLSQWKSINFLCETKKGTHCNLSSIPCQMSCYVARNSFVYCFVVVMFTEKEGEGGGAEIPNSFNDIHRAGLIIAGIRYEWNANRSYHRSNWYYDWIMEPIHHFLFRIISPVVRRKKFFFVRHCYLQYFRSIKRKKKEVEE